MFDLYRLINAILWQPIALLLPFFGVRIKEEALTTYSDGQIELIVTGYKWLKVLLSNTFKIVLAWHLYSIIGSVDTYFISGAWILPLVCLLVLIIFLGLPSKVYEEAYREVYKRDLKPEPQPFEKEFWKD